MESFPDGAAADLAGDSGTLPEHLGLHPPRDRGPRRGRDGIEPGINRGGPPLRLGRAPGVQGIDQFALADSLVEAGILRSRHLAT